MTQARDNTLSELGFRKAVITGASSGIGFEIADLLSKEGIAVYGVSRTAPQEAPSGYTHIEADLQSHEDAQHALAKIREIGPDICVNNAGYGLLGGTWSPSIEEIDASFELLLRFPIQLSREFKSICEERKGKPSYLIQVTSLAIELPIPEMPYYNAAKSALGAFSESVRLDGDAPFRLIDFRPGDYNTPFIDTAHIIGSSGDEPYLERLRKHHRQAPQPEEAAKVLISAMKRGKTGIVRSGSLFQSKIAPLGRRLFTNKTLLNVIRRYYGTKG